MGGITTVLTAPEEYPVPKRNGTDYFTIFLAGGITGCTDWQSRAISLFQNNHTMKYIKDNHHREILLMNPRRANFDVTDISQSDVQITWERQMLQRADLIMFWFDDGETRNLIRPVQPISLYELGKYTARKPDRLVVGCDSDYTRKYDVTFQSHLEGIQVFETIGDVVSATCMMAAQLIRHQSRGDDYA